MDEIDAPPEPMLLESMRAIGYTLRSAVADLIDNSITAGAGSIEIRFAAEPSEYLLVLDDGQGMTLDQAISAMRLGATSPLAERDSGDLGRFGLGLKTASLSQCRELTLLSKHDSQLVGVRWSLDHVRRSGKWSLLSLDATEMSELPGYRDLEGRDAGTVVLWRDLDRVGSRVPGQRGRALDEAMIGTRDHVALVFHRFLSGEAGARLGISINGVPVRQLDPFLSDHRATQIAPREVLKISNERVEVQAFTLPFLNKLKPSDRERAQITGSLRDNQGFYIYRAKRLVIWGTWFAIVPKTEFGKLARVRVDLPNTLDHLWSLDIKKAAAHPPNEVRRELKRVADAMLAPSHRAHRYRGRPEDDRGIVRAWALTVEREGFRYEINRNHPGVVSAKAAMAHGEEPILDALLRIIESTYPLNDAVNRLALDQSERPEPDHAERTMELARQFWSVFRTTNADAISFIQAFRTVEPFALLSDPDQVLEEATRT